MANATLGNIGKPALRRGSWKMEYWTVTAAQTFVVGDHVYMAANGTLSIAAASGNDVGAIDTYGIAAGNAVDALAQTGDRAKCAVWVPSDPTAEFLTQLYHATPASAVLAITDMGEAPIILDFRNQGGIWVASVGSTSNPRVMLTETHPSYTYADQYQWFWARYPQTTAHWYG